MSDSKIIVDALYHGKQVRAIGDPDALAWVAQDVKHALGIKEAKPWKHRVGAHHKGSAPICGQSQTVLSETGVREMLGPPLSRQIAEEFVRWCALRAHEALDRATSPERKPEQMSLAIVPPTPPPQAAPGPEFTDDARELHESLGLARPFSNWMPETIERFGFVEGLDFLTYTSKSTGGRPATNYRLTDHATKRIQGNARGEVGAAAREGLIAAHGKLEQIERIWSDDAAFLAEASRRSERIIRKLREDNRTLEQAVEDRETQIRTMAPDAEAGRLFARSDRAMTVRETAKDLGVPEGKLFDWLEEHAWTYRMKSRSKTKACGYWTPSQGVIKRGIMEQKPCLTPDGVERDPEALVTGKGRDELAWHLAEIKAQSPRKRARK